MAVPTGYGRPLEEACEKTAVGLGGGAGRGGVQTVRSGNFKTWRSKLRTTEASSLGQGHKNPEEDKTQSLTSGT